MNSKATDCQLVPAGDANIRQLFHYQSPHRLKRARSLLELAYLHEKEVATIKAEATIGEIGDLARTAA
jgi:hypothetical protein